VASGVVVAVAGLAFVLVLVSVFVFVVFVHAMVRSMRVTSVIETIHHETLRSIDAVFPPRDHDCVLRPLVEVGTYLATGTVFLEVHGGSVPATREILGCLDLAAVRTLYQDAR
jgi:uncharacterized membrane protein